MLPLLTMLTNKKVKFQWLEACDKSSQELKNRLTSTPILTILEGFDSFVSYYDASTLFVY